MERIKDYEIIEEIQSFGDEIKLWLAENNSSGDKFEILTIKAANEFKKKIDRVLKNEIAPLVGREINGVQEVVAVDFDIENRLNYIVYQNCQEDFEGITTFNKRNLLTVLDILNNLKKENRFGFILSPETILINESNDIILKFIGLFEIFALFGTLPRDYLSPELQNNKKPKLQDDIFSIGKLFIEYLSTKINLDKVVAPKRTERYKKYSDFIEEVEKIFEPTQLLLNRKTIYAKTQPLYETEFRPIIEEMNELCYWTIETNKSEKNDQITGRFSTKTYSGRYYVDNQNYIFVPYSENLNGTDDYIKKEGKIADFNFIQSQVIDFDCVAYFEEQFDLNNELAQLNLTKHDLVIKWKTLPEKEKEFIEEKVFKTRYLYRNESKSNNQNIVFKLKNEFKDWVSVKELKNQNVNLFIDDNLIGKILDFNPNDNFITIKDSKLTCDEIPETGELVQDVRQETSQFKKQEEACVKFEDRDIVNPDIVGILATPEKTPVLNRIDLDYDEFESRITNDYLRNDESQKEAVLEAMNKRPVYLIQGPPGTGKTTVIVELVEQLIKDKSDSKILITSQSNLAVDNVLERLPDKILFMRLASEQVVEKENISAKIEPHLFERKLQNWVEETKLKSETYLKDKFRKPTKNKSLIDFLNFYNALQYSTEKELLELFYQRLNLSHNYLKRLFENVTTKKQIDKIFETELGADYRKFAKLQKDWFAFISNSSTDEGERKKSMLNNGSTEIDLLTAYAMSVSVIGATCIHIASSRYSKIDFKFDYVIMDEASKASPAETLVPINMARNIILIGDHKQLPPVITREEAVKTKIKNKLEDNGLDFEKEFGESMFERLTTAFETNNNLLSYIKMLDIQYRMPRQIGKLISSHFYNGKLKNPDVRLESLVNYDSDKFHELSLKNSEIKIHDDYTDKAITVPNSIVLVSSSSKDHPYDNDNKYDRKNDCNVGVIQETLKQLNYLYNNNLEKEEPFTIGIIAGYRGQVNLLRDRIKLNQYKNFTVQKGNKTSSLIEINTVDKFQGAERDIIIYDIVRSSKGKSNIGFLDDYRRINVAFSRVKRLLVIVGDSEYILKRATLNPNSKFKDFKLQNIIKELHDNDLIYKSFKEAING
ncbi:AAA domain-containing protein [Tenacibaculum maritimum]|uniref:AAA domain-containing protein n=1 Tax=Tenacibaculum maritimum TaxID=107401 RepID=UPI0038769C1A